MITTKEQNEERYAHSRLIAQSVKKAIDSIGVDSRLLASPTRAREVSYCRMIYCSIMYQCTQLSFVEIAAPIRITRAAARKAMLTCNDLYEKYDDFRELADTIVSLSEEKVTLWLKK